MAAARMARSAGRYSGPTDRPAMTTTPNRPANASHVTVAVTKRLTRPDPPTVVTIRGAAHRASGISAAHTRGAVRSLSVVTAHVAAAPRTPRPSAAYRQ